MGRSRQMDGHKGGNRFLCRGITSNQCAWRQCGQQRAGAPNAERPGFRWLAWWLFCCVAVSTRRDGGCGPHGTSCRAPCSQTASPAARLARALLQLPRRPCDTPPTHAARPGPPCPLNLTPWARGPGTTIPGRQTRRKSARSVSLRRWTCPRAHLSTGDTAHHDYSR